MPSRMRGRSRPRCSAVRWIPAVPVHASHASAVQDEQPSKKSKEFDSKAACDEVIKAHNRLRTEAKLPPLAVSKKLQAAAEKHAKDMASMGKMTHKGSDGSSSIHRIVAKGYNYRARRKRRCGLFHRRRIDGRLDG